VQKYGGTSVADLDRIRSVAGRVAKHVALGERVAVVVSAMAGKTNEMVGWTRDLSPMHDAREYDTVVGERGVKLSGGQRQRICIARAFLANPRILILDEATAAVEPESEMLIQSALVRLMQGRTTLIVSHRLSMVRDADLILVIRSGRVVEQGSHVDLMAHDEWYARMYRLQMGEEAAPVVAARLR